MEILSDDDRQHLANVIAELEKKTAGEIRLMLVGRSTQYGHVFPLVWLFMLTSVLLLFWVERHKLVWMPNMWFMPAAILGTFALAWLLARLPKVQRWVTSPRDLQSEVWTRAELEFHREGLSQTQDRTGILIFLSVLEHQAVVLADKGIADKLDKDVWSKVVSKVLEGPRTGQWRVKLEEALRMCGELLAQHFPIQPGDKNELPNHVIVKP